MWVFHIQAFVYALEFTSLILSSHKATRLTCEGQGWSSLILLTIIWKPFGYSEPWNLNHCPSNLVNLTIPFWLFFSSCLIFKQKMNSWEICQLKRLKNNFIWKETSQRMRELSSPFFTRFYYVFLIRKNYLSESINFELGLCISSKYFLTLSGIIISIDWRLIQKSRWLEFLTWGGQTLVLSLQLLVVQKAHPHKSLIISKNS